MAHRLRIALTAAVVLAAALTACAPEPGPASSTTPSGSASAPVPSATSTTGQPTATPTASADAIPGCWTLAVPDVQVTRSETPEEFTAQNGPLVAAGAPATCSLFSSGSARAAGDAWIETFVSQGWADGGVVDDDVYASRSASGPSGMTVSYLIPVDESSPSAESQFQLYQK